MLHMDSPIHHLSELAVQAANSILSPLDFEFEATVTSCAEEADTLHLMLSSPDSSYLIGEDGARLDDLQFLINRLVQAAFPEAGRIRVDCASYRAYSEAKLLRRARSRAQQVLQTGRPLYMEKLNPYQRRLVHHELAAFPGIITESEDTESRFKRITISKVSEVCES